MNIAQIDLVYTGTSSNLQKPSILNNKIIVCGFSNYLAKCDNDCNNLSPLNVPGPTGYWNLLTRTDTNVLYVLSTNALSNNSKVYKSTNSGNSWTLKLDTANYDVFIPAFFDSLEGIVCGSYGKLLRTKNGGNSWTSGTHSFFLPSLTHVYSDSIIIMAGQASNALSYFQISKNRGNTWPLFSKFPGNGTIMGFDFLNKDTILGISKNGDISHEIGFSFNGGVNWTYHLLPIETVPNGLSVKSRKEIYVVGQSTGNKGIILKSTDFGSTWLYYESEINETFMGIVFLNDSIALISGTNGFLAKWNYKRAVFTGLAEQAPQVLQLGAYPNPVTNELFLNYDRAKINVTRITITDLLGRTVYQSAGPVDKISTAFLPPGLYQLKAETDKGQKTLRLVKE